MICFHLQYNECFERGEEHRASKIIEVRVEPAEENVTASGGTKSDINRTKAQKRKQPPSSGDGVMSEVDYRKLLAPQKAASKPGWKAHTDVKRRNGRAPEMVAGFDADSEKAATQHSVEETCMTFN